MDAYGLVFSQMLGDARREESAQAARIGSRYRFLNDPNKVDNLAASMAAALSPTVKRPQFSKFATKVDAYDAIIEDEEHPLKGFGSVLKEKLSEVLKDPRTFGVPEYKVAEDVTNRMLASPGRSGAPKIQEAFEYKRRADTTWFDNFTLGGEDKTVKKLPGYDRWLAETRTRETPEARSAAYTKAAGLSKDPEEKTALLALGKQILDDASPLLTKGEALLGAGIGAAYGAGLLAPLGIPSFGVAPIAGALIGAGLGVVDMLFAKPISKAIEQSEWSKARSKGFTSTADTADRVTSLLTEMLPYVVSGGAMDTATRAAFIVPRAVAKNIAASPTAINVIASGKVLRANEKMMANDTVISRFVNKAFERKADLGINNEFVEAWRTLGKNKNVEARMLQKINKGIDRELAIYDSVAKKELLDNFNIAGKDFIMGEASDEVITTHVKRMAKSILRDNEMVGEAISHPDGFVAGAMQAYAKRRSLRFFSKDGRVPMYNQIVKEIEGVSKISATRTAIADRMLTKVSKGTETGLLGSTSGTAGVPATYSPASILKSYDESPLTSAVLRQVNKPTQMTEIIREPLMIPARTTVTDESIIKGFGKKGMGVSTEKEALEVGQPVIPVKNIGKITKRGKVTEEIIDTASGPKKISYSASKDITKAQAREANVAAIKDLGRQQAEDAALLKEMESYADMSVEETGAAISKMKAAADAGEVTPEFATARIRNMSNTMAALGDEKFASNAYMGQWLHATDNVMSELTGVMKNKKFMAVFGAGAGLTAFFAGDNEAQANIFTSALTGLKTVKNLPKAMVELLDGYKAAGYITKARIPKDKVIMLYDDYQKGLKGSASGGVSEIVKDLEGWHRNAPKGKSFPLRYRLMSPGMIFDEVTGNYYLGMTSPAVFKASWQAAEYVNVIKSNKVLDNILNSAGIKSSKTAAADAFRPLTPLMERQVEFEYSTVMVKHFNTEIERLVKGGGKKGKRLEPEVRASLLEEARKELAKHKEFVGSNVDAVSTFHKEYAKIAEKLVAMPEHSGVRVGLAIGDTATFDKYPFLKNVKFTKEEKEAVGRLKEWLLVYKKRLTDVGEKSIEGDYFPHIFHPDFNLNTFVNKVGGADNADVYMKIFERSLFSRPLMPDVETTMRRYIGDTERRLHQIGFWKKEGWDEVMARTSHIPVINHAFRSLKDGMRPIENNLTNTLSRRLTEFESIYRLFLSPSATLKHLIKQSGDIAQRGIGETVEAYPLGVKMTAQRVGAGAREALGKMGVKRSNQDELMDSVFSSLVPAHGARRWIMDLGLSPQEEFFGRARGAWAKAQNISGAGIATAELVDRSLSIALGLQIAAKKGMTIEQAMYGTFDMILKNNFLSRELNPNWLRNPFIRMMSMFQGTPFKIFERRTVNFVRSGRVVKDLGREMYDMTKADLKNGNFNNARKILRDLRNIRSYVKTGEHELKNIFVDAAMSEVDFFGSPVVSTFAKDMLIIGAATYGGASVGLSLGHHFFHLPFLKPGTVEPTWNINPAASAINRGYRAWQQREEGDEEFLTTKIYQKWLGSGWTSLLPDPVHKVLRVTQNDIPAIYKGSPYQYLFAVPSVKEKK